MTVLSQVQMLMKQKHVDYYIIPTSDYHQSEYVADYFKLRGFLSNFDGSAGTLVIEPDRAGLWTDSRYFLQAENQLSEEITLHKLDDSEDSNFVSYIRRTIKPAQVIAFDARCISTSLGSKLLSIAESVGAKLILDVSFAEELWKERPILPKNKVYSLSDEITGESTISKIEFLANYMKANLCHYHVVTRLDDIAYLLNMRGNDVNFNPVFYAYVSLEFDKDFTNYRTTLYIDKDKLSYDVVKYLRANLVQISTYEEIYVDIKKVVNKSILIDQDAFNFMLFSSIHEGNNIISATSPITIKKAIKNDTEIKNMINYHKVDAVAMLRILYFIKKNIGKVEMSELSIEKKLEEYRRSFKKCIDLSFETIAGYKEHGAIVHYKANEKTNYTLEPKSILLLDSGAQYLGATTDITRSISLGNPTDEEKHDFTAVLKAHLALANAIFPENTTGTQLDCIAKAPLWKEYLTYFHGTGHGVGAFLNVHEGPQRIGSGYNSIGFKKGMVVSNEPGVYKSGRYGIRIENLVYTDIAHTNEFGTFLKFVDLTLVPIDLDLVDVKMLTKTEKMQLNKYHKRVYLELAPIIKHPELREFLKEQTKMI